jgi:hypothetical protein
MTERRVPPAHLLVLVGVSAGAYAVSLAAVTGVQSAADARLHAQRDPIRLAADAARADHDALESAVGRATERYDALARRYAEATGTLADVEGALDTLATRAAGLTETAASLPTRFTLPAVRSAPRNVSPPKTHTTTRGSG